MALTWLVTISGCAACVQCFSFCKQKGAHRLKVWLAHAELVSQEKGSYWQIMAYLRDKGLCPTSCGGGGRATFW